MTDSPGKVTLIDGRHKPRSRIKMPGQIAPKILRHLSLKVTAVTSRGISRPAHRHGGRKRTPGTLTADALLAQDVCAPAVPSEFAQHVQIHPARRERAAPAAVDRVVHPQR
jgi:hypothetical protein